MTDLAHLLFDKYGPTLTVEELARVLKKQPKTVHNKISDGSFPIPTYKESGHRVASVIAVAEYLDRQANTAAQEWKAEQELMSA